ncbi:MAG: aminotransferase class I/II-fold pyridoxal phosphate-dependent enzyme [Acidobacteria bacterium]|nr:aminotransferase class I/II-fold pyridoxal phosphate-dependent enzyme [Acidobacteriota bacterium]
MSTAAIDLRSDTVTRPDDEMRRAMAEAEVGDDVYGEDPTVRRLEEEAAAAAGMEAALFVPSGTMGNQIALHLHGRPGGEVICEALCHVVKHEIGAMAALSGLLPLPLSSPWGLLDPAAVEAAIAPDVSYHSRTVLIEVENSHNMAGGTVYDRPRLEAILAVGRRHGLPVHLDGARIFNAALALGTTVPALTAGFDSVMYCLSKGLGAPVGSLLCGRRDFVTEARRVRKMLGGGMRQAGVLAAAGLVALRKGPARLPADHENAGRLARALAEIPGIELDLATVRTNIVIFRLGPELCAGSSATFLARLEEAGVLGGPVSHDQVRLVTHRDVERAQIDQAIEKIQGLVRVAA